MSNDESIIIPHIARVEGYGKLVVNIQEKKLQAAEMHVMEGARFFEGFIRCRKFDEVPITMSRICAICSVAHRLTANAAVEHALGIKISQQTRDLRELLVYGETIQSHTLHEYYLAIPDYFGYESIIPMVADHGEVIGRGLWGKKYGNHIQRTIGGRAVHPIRAILGGFTILPTLEELTGIRDDATKLIDDTMKTIELLRDVPNQPVIEDKADYAALVMESCYPYYDGDGVKTFSGKFATKDKFTSELVSEETRPYSHTKFSTIDGKSFFVGALARLNFNFGCLTPAGKQALELSRIQVPNHDVYLTNMAQLIETVDVAKLTMDICQKYIDKGGCEEEEIILDPRQGGTGHAVSEAPRGLLVHEYTFNEDNRVTKANVITPTALNQYNMETAAADLVPRIINESKERITLLLNMLIRAYDPCISCSAHPVKIEFV